MKPNVPILLAVAFMALLSLAAIIVIILRAPSTADQLTLIGAIIAFMTPLITSLVALLRAENANGTAKAAEAIVTAHVENNAPPPALGPGA